MSTSLEDIVEQLINADESEYSEAETALYDPRRQEGKEPFVEEVNKCIPALLRRMHGDLNNVILQQRCRKVLITFRQSTHSSLNVLPAILSFIQERHEDPSVARLGFGLIKDGYDYFEKGSVVSSDVLIDSMILHETDPIVQEYAMICMDKFYDEALRRRAPRVMLEAMRNHPNNSDVQVAACDAFYYDLIEDYIPQEWPLTILQAMTNHVHCAKVQRAAFDVLGHIYGDTNDPVKMTLAGQDYVQAILHAMQNHSDDEEVQSDASYFLELITKESAPFPHIIQGGGVELIIRATRMTKTGRRCALVVLGRLLGSSADARRTAIEGGVIPILLQLLRCNDRYWKDRLKIHIFAALNHLLLENIDNAVSLQITSEGGIDTIVHETIMGRLKLKDDGVLACLAMFPSEDGMLPLHYAAAGCDENRPTAYQIAVVEHLLEVYPEAATIRDGSGRLPLHVATQANAPLLVLEHLLEVYPEAATIRDGSGQLPLHVAIQANAPLLVLEALLRVNPATGEAVFRHRDNIMLNFPPVLMAAARDCDLETIFVLLRRYDPAPIMNAPTARESLQFMNGMDEDEQQAKRKCHGQAKKKRKKGSSHVRANVMPGTSTTLKAPVVLFLFRRCLHNDPDFKEGPTSWVKSLKLSQTLAEMKQSCLEDRTSKVFCLPKDDGEAVKNGGKILKVRIGGLWKATYQSVKSLTVQQIWSGLPENEKTTPVTLTFFLVDVQADSDESDEVSLYSDDE